jgi:hypothetical protein
VAKKENGQTIAQVEMDNGYVKFYKCPMCGEWVDSDISWFRNGYQKHYSCLTEKEKNSNTINTK